MKKTMATLGMLAAWAAATVAGTAQAAPVPGQGTWETTLQARDINGDGKADAYYDTVLKVTWLADANAGAGSIYDSTGYTTASDGNMTWQNAVNWAANLNVYGTTGWRLPTMIVTSPSGCDFAYSGTDCGYNVQTISADGQTVYSELAHLYYTTLGNQGGCDTTGNCSAGFASTAPNYMLSNTGPFSNLQPWYYWSGVAYAPYPAGYAWVFGTGGGHQGDGGQGVEIYALAVRPGDVNAAAPVPEPQTYALMLLGLSAITFAARRRRSA